MIEVQHDGADVRTLREMKLEDFLPRPPVDMDSAPIRNLVHNKRVLVTGAGGSIGSEIVRQLVHHGCSHITLVDHSEFLLFEIDYELGSAPLQVSRSAVLCNIRDERRLDSVFEAEKPDIVFHAAALKHVTLVENNPREGVLTNIMGTRNVARASAKCGVRQMVLISTDKAANPSNIMGATKRIAESLLLQASGSTRYCVVRFGNVLGSAGSVVPIFQKQIENGGPVTVTDPLVERFFMTIPEAVQLVLQASALSARGDIEMRKFVLEMGQPVKIIDLARQMIELSGCKPDEDIQIEITGLRPGEKITEILVDDFEDVVPCIPGINEIRANAMEHVDPSRVEGVLSVALADEAGLKTLIYEMIATLRAEPGTAQAPEGEDAPA
jgi:O-antigen biosynthesis protein WbqV